MDILEANKYETACTPHIYTVNGECRCYGSECGDVDSGNRYRSVCGKDGRDFNSHRMGNTTFLES
jgi:cellulose 1,4-beta-cellobiosidase